MRGLTRMAAREGLAVEARCSTAAREGGRGVPNDQLSRRHDPTTGKVCRRRLVSLADGGSQYAVLTLMQCLQTRIQYSSAVAQRALDCVRASGGHAAHNPQPHPKQIFYCARKPPDL